MPLKLKLLGALKKQLFKHIWPKQKSLSIKGRPSWLLYHSELVTPLEIIKSTMAKEKKIIVAEQSQKVLKFIGLYPYMNKRTLKYWSRYILLTWEYVIIFPMVKYVLNERCLLFFLTFYKIVYYFVLKFFLAERASVPKYLKHQKSYEHIDSFCRNCEHHCKNNAVHRLQWSIVSANGRPSGHYGHKYKQFYFNNSIILLNKYLQYN